MMKINFKDTQMAFEYVLYMIASSYFEKTICKTERIERNLLVQYRELKEKTQYEMENRCIAFMDKMEQKFPENFFHQNMSVYFKKNKENHRKDIIFKNDRYILSFRCNYAAKSKKISYSIWKKNSVF